MLDTRRNIVHTNVKSKFLQIRISEEIKNDLQIVAELRGLSTSALIHSLIVKTIRAEKEKEPKAFAKPDLVKGVRVAPSNHESRIKMDTNLEISDKRRKASEAHKKKNKQAS